MTSFYPDSTDHSLQYIQSLREALVQKNTKRKDSPLDIKDVFFIFKNKNINVVEQRSLKGKWLQFKDRVTIRNHQSELSQNKDELRTRVKECLKHLNPLKIKDQATQEFIQQLEAACGIDDIPNIAQRILQAQQYQDRVIDFKARLIQAGASKADAAINQTFQERVKAPGELIQTTLQAALGDQLFSREEWEELLPYFTIDTSTPELLAAATPDTKDRCLHLLELAVSKAIHLAPDEKFDLLKSALKKIQDKTSPPQEVHSPPRSLQELSQKEIAHVLGDSFIKNTEFEGHVNSGTYTRLAADYLRSQETQSKETQRLLYTLDNPLDVRNERLSAEDLRKKIKEVLKECPAGPNGEKRCILFGGWARHAIVYEVEKKANGKYVFRVYNQGQGAGAHEQVAASYRTKFSGFYSIDDIDEKVLFKRSFLNNLQTLTSKGPGADKILYQQILPILGTKYEKIDETAPFQQFLDVQSAGTCVYRSPQAFMARALSREEYRHFHFGYRLYLLQGYLPKAQQLVTEIDSVESYRKVVQDYHLLQKTVQKFSDEVQKKGTSVGEKSVEDAHKLLLQYQILLRDLRKKMLDFEERPLEIPPTVEAVPIDFPNPSLDQPQEGSLEIRGGRLPIEALAILNEIALIQKPDATGADFKQITKVISMISKTYKPLSYAACALIFNQLFQAIGPLKDFHKIDFGSPVDTSKIQECLADIHALLSEFTAGHDQAFYFHWQGTYAMAFYYLSECAFNQLPDDKKVLTGSPVRFLTSGHIQMLKRSLYVDPYWADFIHDLDHELTNNRAEVYALPHYDIPGANYRLSNNLENAIMAHWATRSDDFKAKEKASVLQDRETQKKEIQRIERECDNKINEAEETTKILEALIEKNRKSRPLDKPEIELLETLTLEKGNQVKELASSSSLYATSPFTHNAWLKAKQEHEDLQAGLQQIRLSKPLGESTISVLKDQIHKHKQEVIKLTTAKKAVGTTVEEDPQYWPKGWEIEKREEGGLSNSYKATFIFGNISFFQDKLKEDPLPETFRSFFTTGGFATCMFKANDDRRKIEGALSYHHHPPNKNIPRVTVSDRQSPLCDSNLVLFDNVKPSFAKEWQPLYKFTKEKQGLTENSAPAFSDSYCRGHTPEAAKASSQVQFGYQGPIIEASPLNSEEIRQMLATQSKEVRIESLLSLFEENPERLEDQNWFMFFYSTLFESHLLLDALASPQEGDALAKRVGDFLDKMQSSAFQKLNFAMVGNIMMVKGSFQRCLFHTQKVSPNLSEVHLLLKQVLKDEYRSQWPEFLEGVCAYCAQVCSIPGHEDPDSVALLNLLHRTHPHAGSPFKWRRLLAFTIQIQPKEYFDRAFAKSARDLLSEASLEILKQVFPSLGKLSQGPDPDSLVTQDGRTTISLSSGSIVTKDAHLLQPFALKPEDGILAKFVESHLYTEAEAQRLRCEPIPKEKLKQNFGQSFYIKDPDTGRMWMYQNGYVFLEETDEHGNKEWRELVPLYQNLGLNFALNRNYCRFKSASKLYLYDPQTWKIHYVANKSGPLEDVENPNLKFAQSAKLFADFEDPDYTSCWVSAPPENRLEKIEFQRMNLSFKRDDQDRFECIQKPGWFLSKSPFAPHVTTGFLSLENEKKETKILLPLFAGRDKNRYRDEPKDALNFSYEYDFNFREQRVSCAECDLSDGRLVPTSLEARYQLACLYLETGFTDLAEELLFSPQAEVTHRPLSPEEYKILERIAIQPVSSEKSGQNIRCRLHALYLLERDALTVGSYAKVLKEQQAVNERTIQQEQELKEKKVKLYESYLERLRQITPLDKREEVLILQALCPRSDNPFHLLLPKSRLAQRQGELTSLDQMVEIPPSQHQVRGRQDIPFPETPVSTKWSYENSKYEEASIYEKESDIPAPSLMKRLAYFKARLSNTFPFDYTNPDELKRGLQTFYPYILREAQSFKSIPQGRKSGFSSFCLLLSISPLAGTKEVDGLVKSMTDKYKQTFDTFEDTSSNFPRRVPRSKPIPLLSRFKHATQDLAALTLFSTTPRQDYLIQLRTAYLRTTKVNVQTKEESAIFSDQSFELGDNDVGGHKRFKEMREDLRAAAHSLNQESMYHERGGIYSLEYLKGVLTTQKDAENNKLENQEAYLIKTVHLALTASPISALQFKSGKRQLPDMQDLVLLGSKMDGGDSLRKSYPELSPEAIKNLKPALYAYLAQKQFVQQLGRSLDKLDKIETEKERMRVAGSDDSSNLQVLLNELGNELDAPQAYDKNSELALVFGTIETTLGLKLRPDQIKTIEDFYHARGAADKTDVTLAVQKIMGAGKTSVIQPLLAILFAKPDFVSTVTVPKFLFSEVSDKLIKLLGRSYDRLVFVNPFTRELAQNVGFLTTYLDRLKDAMNVGGVVLLTPQDKYAIYSGLKEAYSVKNKQRVEVLAQICRLLEISEVGQVDEVDMVMDPTIIYKLAIGEKSRIDSTRANGITDMMLGLINDDSFSQEINLDFITQLRKRKDPSYVPKGAALTEQLYRTKVMPKLIGIAEELFLSRTNPKRDETLLKHIRNFLNQTTPFDAIIERKYGASQEAAATNAALVSGYDLVAASKGDGESLECLVAKKILSIRERDAALDAYFTRQQDKDYLGALAKSIHVVLKESLFEEGGVHYSRDQEKGVYTVRPYYAPHSPKPSIPSDPYEMLIKSIQNAFYTGIPRDAVKAIFSSWQREAKTENNDDITQTAAYMKFRELLGDESAGFIFLETPPKEALIDLLERKMNTDAACIEQFVKQLITPQVGFYAQSIETTPQTLAGLSRFLFAYSGTMHSGILPKNMQGQPEVGTIGKVVTAIANKLDSNTSVIHEMTSEQGSYLDQVAELFVKDPDLYVFIDSGNLLKEESTEKWAQKLLDQARAGGRENIQGILYPDADGKWFSLEYSGEGNDRKLVTVPKDRSTLSPDQRLTIITSKHETGTDIPQMANAKAFASKRKNMTLRDEAQSDFRMRQILKGQQVIIGLTSEVREHIGSTLMQEIVQKEPYRTCLRELIEGKNDSRNDLPSETPTEKWIKTAFLEARDPITFESLLAAGSASFTLIDKQEHLWNYLYKNQIQDELTKNLLALDHQMHEVLEKPIRKLLTDTSLPYEQREKLFEIMKPLFVQQQHDSPFSEMTQGQQNVPIATVVSSKIKNLVTLYRRLEGHHALLAHVNANITQLYGEAGIVASPQAILEKTLKDCSEIEGRLLPEYVRVGNQKQSEVQVQTQVQQQHEREQSQQQVQTQTQLSTLPPWPLQTCEYQSLTSEPSSTKSYDPKLLIKAEFESVTPLIPPKLVTVQGLFNTFPIHYSPNMFLGNKLDSDFYLPGLFLLATKQPNGTCQYTLVTHEDADKIKKGLLMADPPNPSCALLTFDGRITPNSAQLADWPQFKETAILSKLLTGKVNFTKEDLQLLESMLSKTPGINKNTAKGDLTTLLDVLTAKRTSTRNKYEGSAIKRFLSVM